MDPQQPGRLAFGLIPWYSLIIVGAIALAIYLCGREEKRLGLPKDTAIDSALWAIPFGIIGARLYYVAFVWEQFAGDLVHILYVWEGGVAIYGALIGGAIGVWIHARRKKISMLTLLDMMAPSVVLAQALGRWGNFFNLEAYGEIVTNPAWQFFPFAVLIPNAAGGTWHLATFFYESFWDVVSFGLLMAFRKKMVRRGDVFLWYVLLYGAGRAVVEGLRLDSLMWMNGAVRVSQWLSLLAMGVIVAIFALRMLKKSPAPLPFIAATAFLLHSFYLLYVGRSGPPPYIWPWLSMAVLALTMVGLGFAGVKDKKAKILTLLPFLVLTAALFLFLLVFNTGRETLAMETAYITLISLSFPAAALAVYPAGITP